MKLINIIIFLMCLNFVFESQAQTNTEIVVPPTPVVKPDGKDKVNTDGKDKVNAVDKKVVDNKGTADTTLSTEKKDPKVSTPEKTEPTKSKPVSEVKTEETIKRKVVYKDVLPGFKAPPKLRLSARGPNAISGGVGLVSGLTDSSTGGFALGFTYNYMLGKYMWADFHVGFNFGGDCKAPSGDDKPWNCSGLSGFGTDLLVGITYRFLSWPNWEIPLNPYARILTGISFIVGDGPNDGAALVVKTAGGLRYSFTEEFAVSGELGLKVGPAFRYDYGAGAFISIDFLVSAEYSF
ncbi:hypothetical protein KKF34_10000 [Myxococcota bacterium]|nr:hypothetical protein [Myxococcota bacterium]MBU1383166.1 hypothetical protein [Myxococcota bacterium]MBU1497198.1 hypothetical protein [Myxococcota bacterium]